MFKLDLNSHEVKKRKIDFIFFILFFPTNNKKNPFQVNSDIDIIFDYK